MSGQTDSKGRPIDQQCRYCGKLFTAKALRKHVDRCPGPDGVRVCDLSGAARARRIRVVVDGVKKKRSVRVCSLFRAVPTALGRVGDTSPQTR